MPWKLNEFRRLFQGCSNLYWKKSAFVVIVLAAYNIVVVVDIVVAATVLVAVAAGVDAVLVLFGDVDVVHWDRPIRIERAF